MFIVLDNAESILDPHGSDAHDIYTMVEELSRLENICLCITSRISTVPSDCNRPRILPLSMESACDIFYGAYQNSGRSDIIRELVQRLDFHALSITLLATTAAQNMWDHDRLAKEWDMRRAQVLRTDHNRSLEATIELSLSSPTFCKLDPKARELLGVVAFFPQGVNEDILDRLFPTIADIKVIFDKFCVLSLAYRSSNFITMLAPLRDYLEPQDPNLSPLLCATKDRYFGRLRLVGDLEPDKPQFSESRWITSEDANVEHLLNIFTSLDTESEEIWDACANFMTHLYWHKPRSTVLKPKIEGLSDTHPSKPRCLFWLSRTFRSLGNHLEQKRLLTCVLELESGKGNNDQVSRTLSELADANRMLGLYVEGIDQSTEGLGICKWLRDTEGQAKCWNCLGWLLLDDKQLDAAEGAGVHAMDLFSVQGRQFWVHDTHLLLGHIYRSKGERANAIRHLEQALKIASLDWHDQLFWTHFSLAGLFLDASEFSDSQYHIERAKAHAVNDAYNLGRAMDQQARIWYQQSRLEEAKAEASGALETFEKLGATAELGWSKLIIQVVC